MTFSIASVDRSKSCRVTGTLPQRSIAWLRFPVFVHFPPIVITLAQQIGETTHCSLLQRKARRHRLTDLTSIMRLAVARGARHYASVCLPAEFDPGVEAISHEELVALLLLGAQPFEPFAIRCAAQILSLCDLPRLSLIARRERVAHDASQAARWRELLRLLGDPATVAPGRLPHWSRFVSHSGVTRDGSPRTDWLHAAP